MELTPSFRALLLHFRPVFTAPSFRLFVLILTGWALSSRHRYITQCIFTAGQVGIGHWSCYHRFFSHDAWSLDRLSHALAQLLSERFAPDGPILLAGDDTLCRKRGLGLFGAGMHHDPLFSSKALKVFSWGHDRVVLALLLRCPRWAPTKVFALPLLFCLYVNQPGLAKGKKQAKHQQPRGCSTTAAKQKKKKWRPTNPNHRTRPQLLVEMLGLGLDCPVVMVHGNHEGFTHLERLVPPGFPGEPVPLYQLPAIEPHGRIRLLPSGWQALTLSGHLVAGIGGIEEGQRQARYHPMAYIEDNAVERLLHLDKSHILLTHQGPSAVQGDHGSPTLQVLLDEGIASTWFHGHSTPFPNPVQAGATWVVPLGDIAFPGRGPRAHEAGEDGWAIVTLKGNNVLVDKGTPPFLREFRQTKWTRSSDDRLISPTLAEIAWSLGIRT